MDVQQELEYRDSCSAAEALRQSVGFDLVDQHSSDLKSLATIASTCKAAQQAVNKRVMRNHMALLAVAAPKHSSVNLKQEHVDSLAWMKSIIGQQMLLSAVVASGLPALAFIMHNVPQETAEQMLRGGFRFSSQQLAAAARCRVSGLEVWLQTARNMGVSALTDRGSELQPGLFEAICCGNAVSASVAEAAFMKYLWRCCD